MLGPDYYYPLTEEEWEFDGEMLRHSRYWGDLSVPLTPDEEEIINELW